MAKNIYRKLGMYVIKDKMYSYDLVYGNYKIKEQSKLFTIAPVDI